MDKYLANEPCAIVVIGGTHYMEFKAYDKKFYFKDYEYGYYKPANLRQFDEEQLTEKCSFIYDIGVFN